MAQAVKQPEIDAFLEEARPHFVPFVEVLTGGRLDQPLHWKLIAEHPKIPKTKDGKKQIRIRRIPVTDQTGLEWLVRANLGGWAVFVTVNEYPPESLHGVKYALAKNKVQRVRASAADLDIEKRFAPLWWKHDQVAGTGSWDARLPLPTMQVESRGGPHLWWVYSVGDEPSVPLVEGINRVISTVMQSDPEVCDAARVLRVPGFFHWKTGERWRTKLVFAEKNRLYKSADLQQALIGMGYSPTEVAKNSLKYDENGWVETIPMTDEQRKRAIIEAVAYIDERPITPQGTRGKTLFSVVCQRLHDYGLATPHALALLRRWADTKCTTEPSDEYPFTDEALADRWDRSGRARFSQRGSVVEQWGGLGLFEVEDFVKQQESTGWAESETEKAEPDESADDGVPPEPPSNGEGPPHPPMDDLLKKSERDGFVKIYVRARHRETLHAVCKVFSKDPRLFEHDGKLVQAPIVTSSGYGLGELTHNSIVTFVTDTCQFARQVKTEEGPVDEWCDIPKWLAGELVDLKRWPEVKPLKSLLLHPRISRDGSLIESKGYNQEDATYYVEPTELRGLGVGSTKDEAHNALVFLLDVIADFPLAGEIQKAASIAAMLTPFCRRAISGPAPMFLIDGNRPNIGKSNLMTVFTSLFGTGVMTLPWSNNDNNSRYQNVQRINTAFLTGQSVLALDNLKGAFGDDVMEMLLTALVWSDRKLGGNEGFVADNFMTVYGTANNVRLISDIWRRVLQIRLVDYGQGRTNPRYVLGEYLPTVRKQLVEACLTILRAYCVAGRPRHANRLGSFESWSDWVAGALCWLGMPDITQLVESEEDALEDSAAVVERALLIEVVEGLCKEKPDGVTAQEITEQVQQDRYKDHLIDNAPAKELAKLFQKNMRHITNPITRADVAAMLKRHRDNSYDGKLLIHVNDKSHRRSALWKVVPLGSRVTGSEVAQ